MATFQYTSPQAIGNQIQVRFVLRLWNQGSQDLTSGKLKLHELRDMTVHREVFSNIGVPAGADRVLRGYLTISEDEYRAWEKGVTPRLTLEFIDKNGTPQQLPVDLSRMMGAENEY